eukprot:Plantae.Rhodophyta-Purpureofilum_apyrenoidigerum.ctg10055.p1 GENE.Plantae.Rhodophyta-Purpureofilum_apyrenoidigerum.ctg10055~~Plantae.Rhodophyta-Purpureofilum_apyrenoidigerum.ctg10055.p1  ORF type:complete len:139 (-),score=28.90 Plantae.Rhodophyta-Purpureofilum_apyrenoidigerum.ctg10055:202-618(-)
MKRPSTETALDAFSTLQKLGLKSQIVGVFQALVDAGLQRDVKVWNLALQSLLESKGGNSYRVDELYGEMRWLGPNPNAATYEILIRQHAKAGRFSQAAAVINDARKSGFGRQDDVIKAIEEYKQAKSELSDKDDILKK